MLGRLAGRGVVAVSRRKGHALWVGRDGIREPYPGYLVPFSIASQTMGQRFLMTAKLCCFLCPPFWFPFFSVKYNLQKAN